MLSRIVRPIEADRTRADHRGRPRCQQRLQARHVRVQVPAPHRVQVHARLAQRRGERDRHGYFDHAAAVPAPHGQPGIAEYLQHGVVVWQHLGDEGLHAAGAGQRDQVLEQQRGDAAPMHGVGDRQGDLGGRPVAGYLVAGHPHQLVTQQAEQCRQARDALLAQPPGLPLGGCSAGTEETEVQVVRRHRLVQPFDGLVVRRACWPDGHRGTVGQQRIGPPGPVCLRERGQRLTSHSAASCGRWSRPHHRTFRTRGR